MKKFFYPILLAVILLGALFLRTYQLDNTPIAVFGDEVDVGYQAYSLLKTGQDYFGNPFPIMLHSYAEYRLPVFIYSAVPFIFLFGLNEWGLRLTGVFWGMVGLVGIYLLASELFKNRRLGLISVGLMAISPWHIQYSRQAGIEAELLLTVLTFGVWAFLKGVNNFKWLLFSVFLFAFSIYCYATSILFTPLLLLLLTGINYKKILSFGYKKLAVCLVLAFVIFIPYLMITISGKTGARFSTISIFSDGELANEMRYEKKYDGYLDGKIFHNGPITYFGKWVGNYLEAFSTDFWFRIGDPDLRQSVGGMGEFYLFEIFTFIAGLIYLLKFKKNNAKLLIGWLLITPIPAALTSDGGYHASRLMPMLSCVNMISAAGFYYLWQNRKKLVIKGLLVTILFLSIYCLGLYFHRYYVDWRRESWRFWQTGFKEALTYMKDNDSKYSRIYLNNTYEATLPRFLFWYGYDPNLFHQQFVGTDNQKNITAGFDGYKIGDKYYFGTVNAPDKGAAISRLVKSNELYLVSARDEADFSTNSPSLPEDLIILKTVYNPYNAPIFYIVTKK